MTELLPERVLPVGAVCETVSQMSIDDGVATALKHPSLRQSEERGARNGAAEDAARLSPARVSIPKSFSGESVMSDDCAAVRRREALAEQIVLASCSWWTDLSPVADEIARADAAALQTSFDDVVAGVEAVSSANDGTDEIVVRLKPDVLGGSEVRVSVSGRKAMVVFVPSTSDAAAVIQGNLPELAARLAERVPNYDFTVSVATPSTARYSRNKRS